MTNIYYDFEFCETPSGILPISLGMVKDTGEEYYAVFSDIDTTVISDNDWIMKNVMNTIEHEEFMDGSIEIIDSKAKTTSQIINDIKSFICQGDQLWAWYGAYDHIILAGLFGIMSQLPRNIPMYTNDIQTLIDIFSPSDLPAQGENEHNALADARFNKTLYHAIMD